LVEPSAFVSRDGAASARQAGSTLQQVWSGDGGRKNLCAGLIADAPAPRMITCLGVLAVLDSIL